MQLVKYHLNKLQDLGIVKISKIEKNSKSQDMKSYIATKFSIVIVPPKFSEKTKESKLLIRSFRHIYKVVGLGIATGCSALLSLSQLQQKETASEEESFTIKETDTIALESSSDSSSEPRYNVESTDLNPNAVEMITTLGPEVFWPLIISTIVLGGLTIFYLIKYFKK